MYFHGGCKMDAKFQTTVNITLKIFVNCGHPVEYILDKF